MTLTALKQQRRSRGEAAPSSRPAQISISQHLLLSAVCLRRVQQQCALIKDARCAHPHFGGEEGAIIPPGFFTVAINKSGERISGLCRPRAPFAQQPAVRSTSGISQSTGCSLDLMGLPRFDPQGFVCRVCVAVCARASHRASDLAAAKTKKNPMFSDTCKNLTPWPRIECSMAKAAILPFDGSAMRRSERQGLFFFFLFRSLRHMARIKYGCTWEGAASLKHFNPSQWRGSAR